MFRVSGRGPTLDARSEQLVQARIDAVGPSDGRHGDGQHGQGQVGHEIWVTGSAVPTQVEQQGVVPLLQVHIPLSD
jgi:hypothetical protein